MKFSVIEDAFDFVSLSPHYENTALVSRTTGRVYFTSESIDHEDDEELPAEIFDDPDFVAVPHKSDLDLGTKLVWAFVAREIPEKADTIQSFFTRTGAHARFKGYLEGLGLLEKWFEFESARAREALLTWCKDEGVRIED